MNRLLDSINELEKQKIRRSGKNNNLDEKQSKIFREIEKVIGQLRAIGRTEEMKNDMIDDAINGEYVFCVVSSQQFMKTIINEINHPFIKTKHTQKGIIRFEQNFEHVKSTEGKITVRSIQSLTPDNLHGHQIDSLYIDHNAIETVVHEEFYNIISLIKRWEQYSLDAFDLDLEINLIPENNKDSISPDNLQLQKEFSHLVDNLKNANQEKTLKALEGVTDAFEIVFKHALKNMKTEHEFYSMMEKIDDCLPETEMPI
jgi:hypothetical protein